MSDSAKVILDTNFLMIPGQECVDIFEEIKNAFYKPVELFVASGTIKELEKLEQSGKGKDKSAARIALGLLKRKDLKVIKTGEEHVDDALVELSKKDYIIATQDLGLKRRLKKYIYMRQKKFIEIRGIAD
ncbi:MAG: PIN domain-containing protein [Nanobdellota archaeon]